MVGPCRCSVAGRHGKAGYGVVRAFVGGCRSALGSSAGPEAPAHAQACRCLWARACAQREWRAAQLPQRHLHCPVAPAAVPLQPHGCPGAPSCPGSCVSRQVPARRSHTSQQTTLSMSYKGTCLRVPGWHVVLWCKLSPCWSSILTMSSTADVLAGAAASPTPANCTTDNIEKSYTGTRLRVPCWHIVLLRRLSPCWSSVLCALTMSSMADADVSAGAGLAAAGQPQPARAVCAASCVCGADCQREHASAVGLALCCSRPQRPLQRLLRAFSHLPF